MVAAAMAGVEVAEVEALNGEVAVVEVGSSRAG